MMMRVAIAAGVLMILAPGAQAAFFLSNEKIAETREAVQDDLFAAGETVSIRHSVAADVFAAGNTVAVEADVAQDVFAAGNQVRIAGAVGDDIMAAGSVLIIRPDTAGDIFAAGSMINLDGTVEGDVYAAGSSITISGAYAGDVRLAGETLVIGEGTSIAGNLVTFGEREPQVAAGVQIAGERIHRAGELLQPSAAAQAGRWVYRVVTWFAAAMAFVYLFGGGSREVVALVGSKTGFSLLVGFLAAVGVLPLAFLLIMTAVGWPLALAVLFIAGAHIVASSALAAAMVGFWLWRKLLKGADAPADIRWQQVLLGAVLLSALVWLPVLGPLAVTAFVLITWGALLQTFWRRLRAA